MELEASRRHRTRMKSVPPLLSRETAGRPRRRLLLLSEMVLPFMYLAYTHAVGGLSRWPVSLQLDELPSVASFCSSLTLPLAGRSDRQSRPRSRQFRAPPLLAARSVSAWLPTTRPPRK